MMSSKLESENRTKKAIEMNAKRQIEDAKRKLELENSRKVRELEEKSKARKAAQEEKMKQLKVRIFIVKNLNILKSILFQNAPRTPAVSTRGDTNTMDYQQHLDAARLEVRLKRESIINSFILSENEQILKRKSSQRNLLRLLSKALVETQDSRSRASPMFAHQPVAIPVSSSNWEDARETLAARSIPETRWAKNNL